MTLNQESGVDARLSRIGWLTTAAALAGGAFAILIMAWPDQVPDSRWSYPFAATPYIVAQTAFGIQHLLLIPGLLAVTRLATSAGRVTRAGLFLAIAATAFGSGIELAGIGAAKADIHSSWGHVLGAAYGVMTLALGMGFLLAGLGFVRRAVLPGTIGRWVYLAIGVWTFFPMLPSLFMPMVWGRITIGTWYLMYVGIGLGLVRLAKRQRA